MGVFRIAATLWAGLFLIHCSAALAQERSDFLTPAQAKAYHACLTAAWIDDYCHANGWGILSTYDRTYLACVHANGGDKFPLGDRHWRNTEEYCWRTARGLLP